MNICKRVLSLAYLVALLLSLCACQSSPDKDIVISKDKAFSEVYTTSPTGAGRDVDIQDDLPMNGEFFSTDQSVKYVFSVGLENLQANMPIVEVVPHYLTGEDAKRVANTLFEGAEFREAQLLAAPSYGKEDIRIKLKRWSEYTNEEALTELLGNVPSGMCDLVRKFIEKYTMMYESAPTGSYDTQCEWKFKKSSFYTFPADQVADYDTSDENDVIMAELQYGDVFYKIEINKRDQSDFQVNSISAYLYDGIGPELIDEKIFRARLCRTSEPTADQIDLLKEKAQGMLRKMELGDWQVDRVDVDSAYYGDIPEYIVNVSAVPVFGGNAASRQPQLSNLRNADEYASKYYLTDAHFQFSANGDLVSFQMYSPVDVKQTVTESAVTLSINKQIAIAQEYLTLRDRSTYGLTPDIIEALESECGEKVVCKVDICDATCALTRIKVPDTQENYYYVPSLTLYGTVNYEGTETGKCYSYNGQVHESGIVRPLIAINAVDGTVIESPIY